MTAYQRGVRLEYLARTLLRQHGYAVIRSAGSHSPIDLVAFKAREVLLVQVKKAGQPLRLPLQQLRAWPAPPHTRKQVWVYEPARGRTKARWRVIELSARKAPCIKT